MQSGFQEAVLHGLSSNPKRLPAEFIFDEAGIRIYKELRDMPENYQAPCERQIFQTHAAEMAALLNKPGIEVLEYGSGDTSAIYYLLKALLNQHKCLKYIPISTSSDLLKACESNLKHRLPGLNLETIQAEFFQTLEIVTTKSDTPRLILIPGSRIGTLSYQEALSFLKQVCRYLNTGDMLLIGVDLKKAPSLILPAHTDGAGITARFNLNLLERINRELGGHFISKQFKHYASYEPESGELKHFLIAQKEQEVLIEKLNRSFHFKAWEIVQTGQEKNYSPEEFRQLCREADFAWLESYYDSQMFFMDVVLQKIN